MACRCTSTEALAGRAAAFRTLVGALLVALLVLRLAAPAVAHEPSRMKSREIVRIAGSFGAAPGGAPVVRVVAVTVQGKRRELHATEWQVYALVVEQTDAIAPAPDSVTLQGTREDLARIASARPEQRVAILAERRPGVGEFFVLAVDLCPAK